MRLRLFAIPLTALALILAGCGGDDSDGDEAADRTTAADSRADTSTDTDGQDDGDEQGGDAAGGEVPDPCALLSADELTGLLGSDQGTGTIETVAPDQRKVCTYDSGLFLAVEVAENYEPSIAAIRAMPELGPLIDVPGVGETAVWQEVAGGVGQFIALGDDYFVGVTLFGDQGTGQAIAEAMLAAL